MTNSSNRASLEIASLSDLLLLINKFNVPIESMFVAIIEINITMMSCGVDIISDVHAVVAQCFVSVPRKIFFKEEIIRHVLSHRGYDSN